MDGFEGRVERWRLVREEKVLGIELDNNRRVDSILTVWGCLMRMNEF